MPTYEYNSITSSGRLMTGTIEASSRQQASDLLVEMGLVVNELSVVREKKAKTAIGRSEFLLFNQQLASITKAGIPLDRGLRELACDVSSGHMKKLITGIAEELEAGVSIEEAVEKRQKHFPQLYGQILKAGVKTGRLNQMLTSLNRHLEMTQRTRRLIIESLSYPLVIIIVTTIITLNLFAFVIPTFGEVYNDIGDGVQMPLLTRIIIDISRNIVPISLGLLVLTGIMAVSYGLLSSNERGRRIKESILLSVPVFGRLYHKSVLSRMAEAMALLVGAGCDMGECLRLAAGASGSSKMRFECAVLAGQIDQGSALLEAGMIGKMIPRLFLYSVQLGAQRNELQDNLHSLSEMYTEQTRFYQSRLQMILMPAALIFIGAVIGTVITAMFLPAVKIITVLM